MFKCVHVLSQCLFFLCAMMMMVIHFYIDDRVYDVMMMIPILSASLSNLLLLLCALFSRHHLNERFKSKTNIILPKKNMRMNYNDADDDENQFKNIFFYLIFLYQICLSL